MRDFLKQHDLVYEAPPMEWGEGLQLGNGDFGVVLWGDGDPLKLTLDKMDIWDLRRKMKVGPDNPDYNYQTLKKVIENRQSAEYRRLFDWGVDLNSPYPTHLRMGRIYLKFGSEPIGFEGRISLSDARATGTISLKDGKARFSGFVHAKKNLLVLEMALEGDIDLIFSPEIECRFKLLEPLDEKNDEILKRWGYPGPVTGSDERFAWHIQHIPENGNYCVIWTLNKDTKAQHVTLLLNVTFSRDGDPLPCARAEMEDTLRLGTIKLYEEHRCWWEMFWAKSALTVPDSRLENLYYVEMYRLGSTLSGKLPPTTNGVWSADGELDRPGMLDIHANLNLQESYWPIYTSNHLELGQSLYDPLLDMLPKFQKFCRDFYGFDGAMMQTALAYDGPLPFGGYWTGSGPWTAHHFWLHYLYSKDKSFLREKAYPFMCEFMKLYVGLLEKGKDGFYHLPWDKSPEWNSDRVEAYGWDSTCSLALVRFLAEALLRCQETLDIRDPDAGRWKEILDKLTPYAQDETGLHIWKDCPLSHSHRHHSHLLPIHPLGLLTIEGTEEDKKLIERSINTWLRRGFGEWIGEDWPHASLIASRLGKGNMAWKFMQIYMDAFINQNSLLVNDDYKEYGLGGLLPIEYSSVKWGKEFSINGGFAAAAAVLEMLLQSWNGIIRVFPAIPHLWRDAYFQNLRAEGAFLVTSRLSERKVVFIEITSEVGGICCVRNPWFSHVTLTNLRDGETRSLDGDILEFSTDKGSHYRLTPKGIKIDEKEFVPLKFERGPDKVNWFGIKREPRF